jgi:hypothetical protein
VEQATFEGDIEYDIYIGMFPPRSRIEFAFTFDDGEYCAGITFMWVPGTTMHDDFLAFDVKKNDFFDAKKSSKGIAFITRDGLVRRIQFFASGVNYNLDYAQDEPAERWSR